MDNSDDIKKLLLEFANRYDPQIERIAFCSLAGHAIALDFPNNLSPSRNSSNNPAMVWKNMVQFFSSESKVLSFFIPGGGVVVATIDYSWFVLIQFKRGTRIGVFSVVAENLAVAVNSLVGKTPLSSRESTTKVD